MKALASKRVRGRVVYVVDERDVRKGDDVLIEVEDGAIRATVVCKGAFSFAVTREIGGDEGRR